MIKQRFYFFVIYHKRLCYYSDVCQNIQWLIEEQVGCWVVQYKLLAQLNQIS